MSFSRAVALFLVLALMASGCAEKKADEPVQPKAAADMEGPSDVGEPEARPTAKANDYGILPAPPSPAGDQVRLAKAIRFSVPVGEIKAMIEADADVNSKDAEGYTPLHSLAGQDCVKGRPCYNDADRRAVAKFLVEKGADVNHQTVRFLTPLQAAIDSRHWDLVEYLKSKGAKVAPEILAGGTLEAYIEKSKKRAAEPAEAPDWLKTDRKPPTKKH